MMAPNKLIAVTEFCTYHNIEISFIEDLYRNELIELTEEKKENYIQEDNLPLIEKIIRLSSDLNINTAGIHTILHLLAVLEKKDIELTELRNRLAFFS